jgi:short subunit dehydrogenase-like uncharacterized protein
MASTNTHAHDIVLWGATGFVGRLVAEYFAEHYSSSEITWALAGRSRAKLESLRRHLAETFDGAEAVPILVADALDRESLDAIAGPSAVVCTTVGPYAEYGSPLVHACGFDSIPSDLGTLMLQEHARRTHGRPCERVQLLVSGAQGGVSGGTAASLSGMMAQAAEDDRARAVLADPYALNPPGERSGPDAGTQQGAIFDEEIGVWTGPFLMAAANEKIVRRSMALMTDRCASAFRYGEAMQFGPGGVGAVKAFAVALASAAMMGAMAIGPLRRLLDTVVLPSPGEGPSRASIEDGYFEMSLYGWGHDDSGTPFDVTGTVAADRDPGYGATATMLAESAICLAVDEADSVLPGGCLTPASGMGMPLVERLRDAGLTFTVGE